jgi:hypothetical protein
MFVKYIFDITDVVHVSSKILISWAKYTLTLTLKGCGVEGLFTKTSTVPTVSCFLKRILIAEALLKGQFVHNGVGQ